MQLLQILKLITILKIGRSGVVQSGFILGGSSHGSQVGYFTPVIYMRISSVKPLKKLGWTNPFTSGMSHGL